ncbi:methyltransferase type 11 [Pseudogulbenkiania sp. NH8B]|uniref:class I SAM-dependent methyltransferase n=1 Tax=Pseudogulbenkiania sp. (strain NH8B) TaxID=748280 RepID=UPI0002279F02|nr:class I SAM-dependent methyltransferase [Pseudogulbenkiania sp. NH8B]BAK77177.1 methyltransferase type 11 [Pseudogulbenkiania sp. NH8B]
MNLNSQFVRMMRCPSSGSALVFDGQGLSSCDGANCYRVNASGIPLFAETLCTEDAKRQQAHFEKVHAQYLENLGYPHTQEYMAHLDDAFHRVVSDAELAVTAEICCGSGEAFRLLDRRVGSGVGVDISASMLAVARRYLDDERYCFIQGDATNLPLNDATFDSVFIIGGIHHVNDRERLFSEIYRVLKPGGRFYWREPVSDFFLWRWLRALIYWLSPALDEKTERPLLYEETVPVLARAGLELKHWETHGFLGYCLLMNSDVLVFNRLFRYLPGIRALTRLMAKLDGWTVRIPGLRHAGLIVIGMAEKPKRAQS